VQILEKEETENPDLETNLGAHAKLPASTSRHQYLIPGRFLKY
jgi:hypothetical protein